MRSFEHEKEERFFQELLPLIHLDDRIMALGQLLYTAVIKYPNNVALAWQDSSLTYKELYYRMELLSEKLKEKGVKPRDKVLLFFENSFEFYIGYFAIVQIGAVVAPLNTFLREKELAHIIDDSQAKLLIASTELLNRLKEDHISNIPPLLTEKDMILEGKVPHYVPEKPMAYLGQDEMAALLYTSGTTGLPKGVMLSSKNIFTNVVQGIARLGFTDQERILGILPLFHVFAELTCVWAPILLGCTIIVVPKIERRHITQGLHLKPTIVFGVPALYGLFCLMKTADFSSVKYLISGGDALPDRIRAAFALIYNRKLACGYGLSETSPVLTGDLDDDDAPTASVGKPVIGVTIAIRDDQGNEVKKGEIGIIWVSGDNIMLGYYNAPEKTAEVLQHGWFNTGDLGYVDEKGKLIITGRVKDMIANKGLKIYPQEVENVIITYPAVIRVAVIGQEDEAAGQVPIAYVQVRTVEPDIENKLRELCMHQLAAYKVPRKFIVGTAELPTTATGKVDKKKLGKT